MYIKQINISGFRNFKEVSIPFHEGVNVIIGHNNTGKSNLLRALGLVLGYYGHRDVHTNDLYYETDVNVLKTHSPKFAISIILHKSENESDVSQEIALFSDAMIDETLSNEAKISYTYQLSDNEEDNYIADVSTLSSAKEIWKILERDYIRKYQGVRTSGARNNKINRDILDKIDYQFLDAIRDVNRDLYAGYNPLLREVLDFFIDYDVKKDESKSDDDKNAELKKKRDDFLKQTSPLMTTLQNRLQLGKDIFLKYAKESGVTFNGATPDFDGELTEYELFSALRLIIKYSVGIEIPTTYNGLGYNNLIYMSLLLAKMQAEANTAFMKRNAKVITFLAIEECEAHLHPAMQYKFLQFLQDNKTNYHIRQTFITTHSTQIVSAVKVEDLLCLSTTKLGEISVGYPRNVFDETNEDDKKSKLFVQRFLDATKSDMFFASKLIFVEGIAEELLLPVFAKYLGYNLTDSHVLVVNMGGRYFNHFLKMFDTTNGFAINKRIACITDIDPVMKLQDSNDFVKCYPYEYGQESTSEYKHHGDEEDNKYKEHPNIRFFRQDSTYGKTLEYDLMRENADCELLLTESVSNRNELKSLIKELDVTKMLEILREGAENTRIKNSINNSNWSKEEKRKAILASRYLNSVTKGTNALELTVVLENNFHAEAKDKKDFHVPTYIQEALKWLLS